MSHRTCLAVLTLLVLVSLYGCSGAAGEPAAAGLGEGTAQPTLGTAGGAPTQAATDAPASSGDTLRNPAGIVVPDGLTEMSAALWEEYAETDCSQEELHSICEYYIATKVESGERTLKNLQWNNVCAWVRHYEGERTWSTGSNDYETLGYEEGECYQAMYKE